MSQLTKRMYRRLCESEEYAFGLEIDQMRFSGKIIRMHNAGWYNRSGEKLGFGDLSSEDLSNISSGLSQGEVFAILSESDWRSQRELERNFQKISPGSMASIDDDDLGQEYIAKFAMFLILPGRIICVQDSEEFEGFSMDSGTCLENVSREDVKTLIYSD